MHKNINQERMLRLIKGLDAKEEVFVNDDKKEINEEVLNKELIRLKSLSNNMHRNESFSGPGMTVNKVVSDTSTNPQDLSPGGPAYPGVKNVNATLQPNEALEIAIKRSLASGAPINDLDFYSEVNWHLAALGFSAQSAVMIKEIVTALINK